MTQSMTAAQELAQAVAFETADDPSQVGDFLQVIDLGEGVSDFRFACRMRGYEGWQWAVTLFRDADGAWSVNEASLVATDESLLAPQWVPWKDRIEAKDISVTDALGTDPDDPRLEPGYQESQDADESVPHDADQDDDIDGIGGAEGDEGAEVSGRSNDGATAYGNNADHTAQETQAAESQDGAGESKTAEETAESDADGGEMSDLDEVVEEFSLSRRHVLSALGRSQTAKRWYQGQRGPKSLSTKTAAGNVCSTCGFAVPMVGELGTMFAVCANRWSPDDAKVVSLDHGCGEHSEIEQPEPSRLWMQTKPAYDDVHIDVFDRHEGRNAERVELLEDVIEDAVQS